VKIDGVVMKTKTRARILGIVGGAAAVTGAFLAGRARADGVPATGALTYAGALQDANGQPLTGTRNLQVNFWNAATGGTTPACQTASAAIALEAGRFAIALPDTCTAAVRAKADVWSEVMLDGTSLGRAKLGAVPYAIEAMRATEAVRAADATRAVDCTRAVDATRAADATRASEATGKLAQQIVPAGAVMAFDLATCPAGWAEYTAARNRTLIGLTTGLSRGTAVGSNSVALTVAQMPSHTHTGTTATANPLQWRLMHGAGEGSWGNHAVGFNSQATYTDWLNAAFPGGDHTHNFTTNAAGSGQAFDNRQESLPVLYCKKL